MGKKIIVGAIGVVVVAAVLAAVLVSSQLDRMVANAVETYGSAATGTDVSLGGVDIALTDSRSDLERLTIGNPAGFSTDYALRVNDIQLTLDLSSLSGGTPVVTEVLLDGAHVNAEQRGESLNLTDIQRYMGQSAGEPAAETQDEGRIIIDHFRLTNARVTLTSELSSEPEDLELGDVVVDGIGRGSGGATYAEAAEAILGPILAAARSAVQERLRNAATDAARERIEEEASEKLRDLLDRD